MVYPMNRIRDALELMKGGKHIGKVVLTNYDSKEGNKPAPVTVRKPQKIYHPNGTYIVTGGAGGFGSRIVRGAFRKGARHFVITVTKAPERVQKLFKDILHHDDVTIEAVVCDTAKEDDILHLLSVARSKPWPLVGIFHAAGISGDQVLERLTVKDLESVGGCKAMGAWYLHKHTLQVDQQLETFVVISSLATATGGRGRAAYCGANCFLNSLIRLRRQQGLPGTAFCMGSLSDVGILADDIKVRKLQLKMNAEFIPSKRALKDLEDMVVCQVPVATQLFFREQAKQLYGNWASFLHGVNGTLTIGSGGDKSNQALTLAEVTSLLITMVKSIGGHDDVSTGSPLFSVGMDSFSSVELNSQIKERFAMEISIAKLGPAVTVGELSKVVFCMISGNASAGAVGNDGGEEEATGGAAKKEKKRIQLIQPVKKAPPPPLPSAVVIKTPSAVKSRQMAPPTKMIDQAEPLPSLTTIDEDDGVEPPIAPYRCLRKYSTGNSPPPPVTTTTPTIAAAAAAAIPPSPLPPRQFRDSLYPNTTAHCYGCSLNVVIITIIIIITTITITIIIMIMISLFEVIHH